MPPSVKVTTTRGVVVALDAVDEGFPDAGPLADLGHGETGPATRVRQVCSDAHDAPPLPKSLLRCGSAVRCFPPSRAGPQVWAGLAAGRSARSAQGPLAGRSRGMGAHRPTWAWCQ